MPQASPQLSQRERFFAQADKVLSFTRRRSAPRPATRSSSNAVESSSNQLDEARGAHAFLQGTEGGPGPVKPVAMLVHEAHRRTSSASSVASTASVDEDLFELLVAAFPPPPVENDQTTPMPSPSYFAGRSSSSRSVLPPPGAPPTAPLPPTPALPSVREESILMQSTGDTRQPRRPSLPLVHSSNFPPRYGSLPDPALSPPASSAQSPDDFVPEALARFAFPPSHGLPTPRLGAQNISTPAEPCQHARSRTESTASTRSDTSEASRASVQMENITAELALLVESFRSVPQPDAERMPKLRHGGQQPEGADAYDEAERRRVLRRVRSTMELQRRKASVASSVRSVSTLSETGNAMTTGGYRAYKLTRRVSLLPPQPRPGHRRASSTSSQESSGSSNASEAEELFDLAFDTPGSSPAIEYDSFSWTGRFGHGYGRRKSSATTIGSTIGMERSKSDQSTRIEPVDGDEEVLASTATKRTPTSTAPHPHSERTLTTARSTPILRRPALDLPTSSLSVPPVGRPLRRKSSFGGIATTPLPPLAELESGVSSAALPRTLHPTARASGLKPLVTASAARAGPVGAAPTSMQSSRFLAPSSERHRPLLIGTASSSSHASGVPLFRSARTSSLATTLPSAPPTPSSPRAAFGRRTSLQTLPYIGSEREVPAIEKRAVMLPRR